MGKTDRFCAGGIVHFPPRERLTISCVCSTMAVRCSALQALGVEFVDVLCARRTCGEASTTEVAGRRRGATISEGECPYLGLKAFQPEDAALFFGRAAKIQELNDRLRNGFGHDQRRNTDLL
jgi:hypothetical protein